MTRYDEIQARLAEINAAVEANPEMGADELRSYNDEIDTLKAERAQIEARQQALENSHVERKSADKATRTAVQERGHQLRTTGQTTMNVFGDLRALTLSTSNVLHPVEDQKGINGPIGAPYSSIVDLVKATDCAGMTEYRVPYISAWGVGQVTAEGVAPDSTYANAIPTYGYADIKPITITTYGEISREILKQTDAAYAESVQESCRVALRAALAKYIVNGDGAGTPVFVGIKGDGAIASASDVTLTAIGADTLRKIALSYGGDEAVEGQAVLFLTKKDLIAFGDVRGTNEKKPVYEITPDTANPNTGIIRDGGLAVRYCLNSNLTAVADASANGYTMLYGVPSAFELGIFSDLNVRVSEDFAFKTRMLAVLGEIMVGGAVVMKNGFIRLKKVSE